MLMIIESTDNIIIHSKDAHNFPNNVTEYGNTFAPKEITMQCAGLYVFLTMYNTIKHAK